MPRGEGRGSRGLTGLRQLWGVGVAPTPGGGPALGVGWASDAELREPEAGRGRVDQNRTTPLMGGLGGVRLLQARVLTEADLRLGPTVNSKSKQHARPSQLPPLQEPRPRGGDAQHMWEMQKSTLEAVRPGATQRRAGATQATELASGQGRPPVFTRDTSDSRNE